MKLSELSEKLEGVTSTPSPQTNCCVLVKAEKRIGTFAAIVEDEESGITERQYIDRLGPNNWHPHLG